MFAIIEESGGQRKVREGEQVLIDLVGEGQSKPGDKITFDRVLAIGEPGSTAASGKARLGTPYVRGAAVTAEVVEPVVQGEKLHIYKFRPKKTYRRKTGHRQRYTSVRITSIKA